MQAEIVTAFSEEPRLPSGQAPVGTSKRVHSSPVPPRGDTLSPIGWGEGRGVRARFTGSPVSAGGDGYSFSHFLTSGSSSARISGWFMFSGVAAVAPVSTRRSTFSPRKWAARVLTPR